jgi:hypothetical protein
MASPLRPSGSTGSPRGQYTTRPVRFRDHFYPPRRAAHVSGGLRSLLPIGDRAPGPGRVSADTHGRTVEWSSLEKSMGLGPDSLLAGRGPSDEQAGPSFQIRKSPCVGSRRLGPLHAGSASVEAGRVARPPRKGVVPLSRFALGQEGTSRPRRGKPGMCRRGAMPQSRGAEKWTRRDPWPVSPTVADRACTPRRTFRKGRADPAGKDERSRSTRLGGVIREGPGRSPSSWRPSPMGSVPADPEAPPR